MEDNEPSLKEIGTLQVLMPEDFHLFYYAITDFYAGTFDDSESGSITPETIGEVLVSYDKIMSDQIMRSTKVLNLHIKAMLELKTQALSNITLELSKLTQEYRAYMKQNHVDTDILTNISDLNKIAQKQASFSQKNEEILESIESLESMYKYFGNEYIPDSLILKTYVYSFDNHDIECFEQVQRLTLVPTKLKNLAGQILFDDILHPLELTLLTEASTILMADNKSCGVICDIFVRKDGKISKTSEDTPETHSIVLWKESIPGQESQIYVIDPNKSNFSSHLIPAFKNIFSLSVVNAMQGTLYAAGGKEIGRAFDNARDCIDIAVKIIFELLEQTKIANFETPLLKLDKVFSQISNEPKFAKHFGGKCNRNVRELTATTSSTRHIALNVLKTFTNK